MKGIYKITSPSGKRYIGQSIDLLKRFRDYRNISCKQQPLLLDSLRRQGWENHIFEILIVLPENTTATRLRTWEATFYAQARTSGAEMLNSQELTGMSEISKKRFPNDLKWRGNGRG